MTKCYFDITADGKPLGRIVGYADAEIEPIDFAIAPQYAAKKVLARTGLTIA